MEINLTPEQKDFIRRAVETGRVPCAEDALQEAMTLWVERERRIADILEAVDKAETSLARGEGTVITQESMHELAADIHKRGMARLAAQAPAPR